MFSIFLQVNSPGNLKTIPIAQRDRVMKGYLYYGSSVSPLAHTYVNGSQITRWAKDDLEFHNPWMPAGAVVARWDLSYDYSNGRLVPDLPLLTPGKKYQIKLIAEMDQPAGLLVRLLFFNFDGHIVARKVMRQKQGEFVFPEEADFYAVELVNAGVTSFRFHRIDIAAANAPEAPRTYQEEQALRLEVVKQNLN